MLGCGTHVTVENESPATGVGSIQETTVVPVVEDEVLGVPVVK